MEGNGEKWSNLIGGSFGAKGDGGLGAATISRGCKPLQIIFREKKKGETRLLLTLAPQLQQASLLTFFSEGRHPTAFTATVDSCK